MTLTLKNLKIFLQLISIPFCANKCLKISLWPWETAQIKGVLLAH